MTEKMLTYALGRGLESYDRPAVKQNRDRAWQRPVPFFQLWYPGIVNSLPFQERRGTTEILRKPTLKETNRKCTSRVSILTGARF